MQRFVINLLLMIFTASYALKAQEQTVVQYSLADRDRVIRVEGKIETIEAKMDALETKMEALETKMDAKFEAVNARIDYLFWLQGVIVALILFILGYTIWDRRTALQPALEKSSDAVSKSENLIKVLREYAKNHPDLANILRSHGLL